MLPSKQSRIPLNTSTLSNTQTDMISGAPKDAKLKKSDIDDIVLVGGSTRIPKAQNMLEEHFGKKARKGVNSNKAVAFGAAIQGGILSADDAASSIVLMDLTRWLSVLRPPPVP
jgi:molecular chaperone DnaK (HSP70)